MTSSANLWLVFAGGLSAAASVAHLACIFVGSSMYRFMGAGEQFAVAAQRGSWTPAIVTSAIVCVLAVWALYAFSGAGLLRPLPRTRLALVAISAVLFARASLYFVHPRWRPDLSHEFMAWSSGIVLVMAVCFAAGTIQAWPSLSARGALR